MAEQQNTTGNKVLYVDDEAGLALLGEEFLGDLGYQVVGLTSGGEALSVFAKASPPFEIVVTDESMPGMSGIELAQKIYQLNPAVPVILCSGHLLSMEEPGMDATNIVAVLLKTEVCLKLPDLLAEHL